MKRLTLGKDSDPDTALLIKESEVVAINKVKLGIQYFAPIAQVLGAKVSKRTCVIGTYQPSSGKVKKKDLVTFAGEILEYCATSGITTLLVADGDYFKYLSGAKAVEKHIGEKFECVVPDYGEITVVPMINYTSVLMFPEKQELLDQCNAVAAEVMAGSFTKKEDFEFESYELLLTPNSVREALEKYRDFKYLACDIETTGLPVGPTELLTTAFAKDDKNAFAFPMHPVYEIDHEGITQVVKDFYDTYQGRLIFHNGLYDAKQIIYNMYMKDFNDMDGMIKGCKAMKFEDTFLMAYVLKNSTAHPKLGLKDLTYDYLGDYGEDVKNAIDLPLEVLARYNAKDVCGTFHIFNKFKAALDTEVYQEILEPSLRPLLKMMLNGMPLNMERVAEVGKELQEGLDEANAVLLVNDHVKLATRQLRQNLSDKYNKEHKVKQKQPGDFLDFQFNPNSTNQLRILLFDVMGFEPVEFTKTKMPSTNRASIEEFVEYADVDKKPALEALIKISQTAIVLSTFIGAFNNLSITQSGATTLHGNLKLCGTQSGRMSSNSPNLQNLSSSGPIGKAIKSCFVAPEGFLWAGADFNALKSLSA